MKKGWFVLVTMAVLLLSACSGSQVDEETAKVYSEQAEEIVILLNEGKKDDILSMLNDDMKAALTDEQLQEVIDIVEASGEFNGIDKSTVEEKDEYYVTTQVADYSEENRVFTITLDQNQQIAGLFIK